MALYKEDIVDIDLAKDRLHRSFLPHSIGTGDVAANRFGIRVFRNGEEESLTGCSCFGYFRDPMGNNIALTSHGTIDGNLAYITLPQACYNYDGQFTLAIKLIGGGVTGTMRIVDGVVDNTNTGGAVAPTETVPTYTEVLAVYDQMQEAVEDYDDTVTEQNTKIDNTKSALDYARISTGNDIELITGNKALVFQYGQYRVYNDNTVSDLTTPVTNTSTAQRMACAKCACVPGDKFTIKARGKASSAGAYGFFDADFKGINRGGINTLYEGTVTAPSNAAWFAVNNDVVDNPTDFYAYKGDSLKSIVEGVIDNKIGYVRQLNNTYDLNDVKAPGWYRWVGSSLPGNAPTNLTSNMLVIGSYGVYTQIGSNVNNVLFVRIYNSPSWSNWMRLADNQDIQDITEKISNIVSIATITGNVDDSYSLFGITFTKKADNEFTLTGKSTGVTGKGFNVLLGAEETVSSSSAVLAKNITTPGTYTLAFKASGAKINEEALFALTDGTFGNRRYIKSGESFTVEDDSVCLFVYGSTKLDLTGKTLTVKWALYQGDEYIGFPYVENNQLIAVDPIARNLGLRKPEEEKQNEIVSWGKSNTMANAKQIMEIEWQPTAATMPRGSSTYFDMDTKYKGMPYSSVRDNDKAVGTNVSLHTFMTAVNDPNSVLYTRRSTTSNAQAYYGTVCSGLCNHAYALGLHLTNGFLGTCDWFDTIPMQDIQRGDMIYKPGHVAMIYDVGKDEWGRIENVTVMEEWAPNSRVKYYSSYQAFLNGRDGYIARRYKYLSGVQYKEIPYVRCFDEDQQDIVYPDVQTDHGDQAVFGYCAGAGQDFTDYANISGITINVINARDFSSIVVTREGAETPVYSTGNIQSFTIPGADILPGLYTITATGSEYTSVSTFFVADVSGTWNKDTGAITFSSTNATPVLVDVYAMPIEDGKYVISCSSHVITDEERTAGSANVLDLVDTTHQQAKVTFDTPYGQAIWRSEAHPTWTAIT